MKLDELITVLTRNSREEIQIRLPDRAMVPAHFHVTEVARVQKDFIDCGGTFRSSTSCVLQVWVANDVNHRLDANKLLKIISKGSPLFGSMQMPLEVEYDDGRISQYPVLGFENTSQGIVLVLGAKHTACLAPDRCGVQLDVVSGCSGPGCC